MSRLPTTPKLPPIAVEDENIKRSLSLPSELDRDLALYSEYFQAQTNRKPRSSEDVMVGVITAYLAGDVLFQRWKKERLPVGNGERSALSPDRRTRQANSPTASIRLNGAAAST